MSNLKIEIHLTTAVHSTTGIAPDPGLPPLLSSLLFSSLLSPPLYSTLPPLCALSLIPFYSFLQADPLAP